MPDILIESMAKRTPQVSQVVKTENLSNLLGFVLNQWQEDDPDLTFTLTLSLPSPAILNGVFISIVAIDPAAQANISGINQPTVKVQFNNRDIVTYALPVYSGVDVGFAVREFVPIGEMMLPQGANTIKFKGFCASATNASSHWAASFTVQAVYTLV